MEGVGSASPQTAAVVAGMAPDLSQFPEFPLWGRYERAYEWTPDGLENLLDAGCAWGYGTRFFTTKARSVYGIDPNDRAIAVARRRYPEVTFVAGELEGTPFPAQTFDAVVCCDTLEHVADEGSCLNELWRILRPGGVVTITVPHSGPLAFLDPDNYGRALLTWAKERLPGLYRWYRTGPARGDPPGAAAPLTGSAAVHRHYTLKDLQALLEQSAFGSSYEIRRVRRSGFVLEALVTNLHFFLRRFVRGSRLSALERLFAGLLAVDYRIPYHRLSNNIAIQVVKLPVA
jgi:SAM-dependent methyltransferase